MRNDARPIGEQFRDIAEHSERSGGTKHEPAGASRRPEETRGAEERPAAGRDPADSRDQSDR